MFGKDNVSVFGCVKVCFYSQYTPFLPSSVEHDESSHPGVLVVGTLGQQYHVRLIPRPDLKRMSYLCGLKTIECLTSVD